MLWSQVDDLQSVISRLKHERRRLDEINVDLDEENIQLKSLIDAITIKNKRLSGLLEKESARSAKNWNIS